MNSLPVQMVNRENCYMTCAGRNDGVGAQIQGVLSTLLFCNDRGIQYVHSPFAEIAHRPLNQHNWEKDWERFFNLGQGELQMDELTGKGLHIVKIEDREKLPQEKEPNTLFVVPHCHHYADTVPDNYLKLKDRVLQKYHSSSKEKYASINQLDKINIAVHIRRGDVSPEKHPNRYTENGFIAQLLADIQSMLSDLGIGISINIFSQGHIEDFQELKGEQLNFYLDHCLFSTFHNMVAADILITGKSSFSYTAALFSSGVIVYEPFWHQPQQDWFTANKLAPFDAKDFKNKVFNKLLERGRLSA